MLSVLGVTECNFWPGQPEEYILCMQLPLHSLELLARLPRPLSNSPTHKHTHTAAGSCWPPKKYAKKNSMQKKKPTFSHFAEEQETKTFAMASPNRIQFVNIYAIYVSCRSVSP